MRFLRRKKEDFEEQEESGEDVPATKPDSKSSYKLSAQFERLKAKVDALGELRKADSERFTRISEQIGEMHNLILDKEKSIEEINAKATKAADLVEELKPESMISELKKSEVKYETFDAKIDAINSLYRKVIEELKSVRERLSVFNGTEELVKLNSETAENLARIRQSEANIERQTNKAGNMFIQFQKQFAEWSKFRDWAEGAEEEFRKMKGEFDSVKTKADSTLMGRKDLEALRLELQQSIQELKKSLSGGKEGVTAERMKNFEKRFDILGSSLGKTDNMVKGLMLSASKDSSGALNNAANDRLRAAEGQIATLNGRLVEIANSMKEKGAIVEKIRDNMSLRKDESETIEEEYYRLAEEVKAIARSGPVYQAIVKYNVLKDMYGEIAGVSASAEKRSSLYAALKDAFDAVNEARNRLLQR